MVFIIILLSRRIKMGKKTLGIIIGCNTAVTTAAVTCVTLVCPDKAPIINGVVEAVSGCFNAVCLVFMKNGALPAEQEKKEEEEEEEEEEE